MNHQDLYKLLVTVQKNVRCPQCGKSYDFPLIQIRGIVDSLVFLELNCSGHMPLLATVSLAKQTPATTLSKTEVTSNDVIETYKFFKDFNGSFENLFENSKNNNTK
jgi:hypothetical protein